jgi:hypothetical protein
MSVEYDTVTNASSDMPEILDQVMPGLASHNPKILDSTVLVETMLVPAQENHRTNGTNGTQTNGVKHHTIAPYQVSDQPLGTIKPMRIICIGAGASGINMAYQTKNYLEQVELVCYEKNPEIGGTWYENRYPGCKCDIRKWPGMHQLGVER